MIVGIKGMMEYLGCGKHTATRILNTKGCPVLPRGKGGTYRIREADFDKWISKRNGLL